jgi:hypothetical protein
MRHPDLSVLSENENARRIVEGVGRESVDVYLFLREEFARGPVIENFLFQFVYRSFYRIDNAGLTPEFKSAYFECLEQSRDALELDLGTVTKMLQRFPNRKGQENLQFSFVTKLANTVNPAYPIYDAEVAKVFGFRPPYAYKPFDERLQQYLAFYQFLRQFYDDIITRGVMNKLVELFEETYSPRARVPPVKILDFIFWSAGKFFGETLMMAARNEGMHPTAKKPAGERWREPIA